MPLYRKGLLPLTADPMTFGHLDIIKRAAEQCQHLIVLLARNQAKKGRELFTLEERVEIIQTSVRHREIANVTVLASEGLTVDVFLREGCDRIFRGVRNAKDREYEDELASFNADILGQDPSAIMVYIQARPDLMRISSTAVKELVGHGLNVEAFVPMFVKQKLEERILGQCRIGITGGIAVGKTRVAFGLVAQANQAGIPAQRIGIDDLLRDLYAERSYGAQNIRDNIGVQFGAQCLKADRSDVNRPALSRRITEIGTEALQFLESLTKEHVARKYREKLAGAKGLIVLEWSQLAEMGMSGWVNNNVIMVYSPDRAHLITKRGIDSARLAAMDAVQWSTDRKHEALERRAISQCHGAIMGHQNVMHSDEADIRADIGRLLDKVHLIFPSLSATAAATP